MLADEQKKSLGAALISAVYKKETALVKELIEAGAPLNHDEYISSSDAKSGYAYPAVFQAIRNRDTETLSILLSAGADLSIRAAGLTAMGYATYMRYFDMVAILTTEIKKRQGAVSAAEAKSRLGSVVLNEDAFRIKIGSEEADEIAKMHATPSVKRMLVKCSELKQFVIPAELFKLRKDLDVYKITLQSQKSTGSEKELQKTHKYNVLFAALNLIDSKIRGDDFLLQAKFIVDFGNALKENHLWNHIDHDFFGLRKSETTKLIEKVQPLMYATLAAPLQNASAAAAASSSSTVSGAAMFAARSTDDRDALDRLAAEMQMLGRI